MGHEFRGTQKVNPDSSIGMDCLVGLGSLICEATLSDWIEVTYLRGRQWQEC